MVIIPLATEIEGLAGDKQTNNEAKEAQNGAEDLDDENLDETGDCLSVTNVCQGQRAEGEATHSVGSAASANAAPLPLIPTARPQTKLHMPTIRPDQKRANPV